jgi:DNA-binding LytR/AlgR family response regulator
MSKYKVLIVEDRQTQITALKNKLEKFPSRIDMVRVRTARSLAEAIRILETDVQFDFSILDKWLSNNDISFSLVESYKNKMGTIVVKTQQQNDQRSLLEQMSLGSYKILRTPFSVDGIRELLDEIDREKILAENNVGQNDTSNYQGKLFLLNDGEYDKPIPEEDIICIIVSNRKNYCTIHFLHNNTPKRVEIKVTLTDCEDALSKNSFVRIHDSMLVNIQHIEGIIDHTVKLKFILLDKEYKNMLPISESKYKDFKNRFNSFRSK